MKFFLLLPFFLLFFSACKLRDLSRSPVSQSNIGIELTSPRLKESAYFMFSMNPQNTTERETLSSKRLSSGTNDLTMISRNALEKRFLNVKSEFDQASRYLKIEISEMEIADKNLYVIDQLKIQISANEESESGFLIQIQTNIKNIEIFAEQMAHRRESLGYDGNALAKKDIIEMVAILGLNEELKRQELSQFVAVDHFNCLTNLQFIALAIDEYPTLNKISECQLPLFNSKFQADRKVMDLNDESPLDDLILHAE